MNRNMFEIMNNMANDKITLSAIDDVLRVTENMRKELETFKSMMIDYKSLGELDD